MKQIVRYLKLVGILVLATLSGYFIFLLILKVTGGYEDWKKYIETKYGVGIWDF